MSHLKQRFHREEANDVTEFSAWPLITVLRDTGSFSKQETDWPAWRYHSNLPSLCPVSNVHEVSSSLSLPPPAPYCSSTWTETQEREDEKTLHGLLKSLGNMEPFRVDSFILKTVSSVSCFVVRIAFQVLDWLWLTWNQSHRCQCVRPGSWCQSGVSSHCLCVSCCLSCCVFHVPISLFVMNLVSFVCHS